MYASVHHQTSLKSERLSHSRNFWQFFNMSIDMIDMLNRMDNKLSEVLPQVQSIESRLKQLVLASFEVNNLKISTNYFRYERNYQICWHYSWDNQKWNWGKWGKWHKDCTIQLMVQSDQGCSQSVFDIDSEDQAK